MAGPISFELLFTHDPKELPRASRSAIKTANQKAGEYEDEQYIPKHFQPGADKRYGYKPRRSRWGGMSYEQFKRQQGLPPLVFTGATRDMVETTGKVTSQATFWRLRARVPIAGSTRLNRKNLVLTAARKNVERIVAEVEVIAEFEKKHLANVTRDEYVAAIDRQAAKRRRVTIR